MGPLLLVRRNLGAHPVRSALLFAFGALSLFLCVFLRSVLTTLDDVIAGASPRRLMVQSGVGLFTELPTSYAESLVAVPGVASTCRTSWFGGTYRDGAEAFPSLAVDLEAFLRIYPELSITPAERAAVLADRRGCILGRHLAQRLHLGVGDRMPIFGTLYPRPDGGAWEFIVRAIYVSDDPAFPESIHLFHWIYLDEGRREIAADRDAGSSVSAFVVEMAPGHAASEVSAAIDARYDRGPQRTHTQTEAAHRAEEIAHLGSLPRYLEVVGWTALAAMLLAVINAMAIAGRERSAQIGVLKALGFGGRTAAGLVTLESLVVVGGGGAAGVGLALASQGWWRDLLGGSFSVYTVRTGTAVAGVLVAAAVAALGSLPPAIRLARARPLDVLRLEA